MHFWTLFAVFSGLMSLLAFWVGRVNKRYSARVIQRQPVGKSCSTYSHVIVTANRHFYRINCTDSGLSLRRPGSKLAHFQGVGQQLAYGLPLRLRMIGPPAEPVLPGNPGARSHTWTWPLERIQGGLCRRSGLQRMRARSDSGQVLSLWARQSGPPLRRLETRAWRKDNPASGARPWIAVPGIRAAFRCLRQESRC